MPSVISIVDSIVSIGLAAGRAAGRRLSGLVAPPSPAPHQQQPNARRGRRVRFADQRGSYNLRSGGRLDDGGRCPAHPTPASALSPLNDGGVDPRQFVHNVAPRPLRVHAMGTRRYNSGIGGSSSSPSPSPSSPQPPAPAPAPRASESSPLFVVSCVPSRGEKQALALGILGTTIFFKNDQRQDLFIRSTKYKRWRPSLKMPQRP